MRYLARREHSRAELLHKLRSKGYDEAVAGAAIDALAGDGLQDDARCAESVIRARAARGNGPQRIRQALRAKGLTEEGSDTLVDHDWDDAIAAVYARKYGRSEPASPKEYAARVRFLSQRGFYPGQIAALMRRLRHTKEFDDSEPDDVYDQR